ncbi:cytochrome c biogenesis protein CcdA [Bacillus licheniformis]|uniref:cytochrome c biogenesis CcdA family protein n=1 Tax=Bacillus licheniformis TaxID=1402 RepID=UPI00092BF8C0|nr:cytochrome c biogenesis protein CcdA [Bacillus licheniformis]MCY7776023.1 cytochrome c biogenesis protein CcdA [Bacillus licheniformis]MCY7956603.1 cytochrome c biogenesis protein CcdA [Bacillus licheniformis]MCY8020736.1 cytochrome c biogenesis protein CcdA [Bacillus licheniformis]MCY8528927.1 cytochrome c biogenesis protein CcdA [Bacillus licheniformis]MCY8743426.1 cytochrome c biogenesis protein CcdA [Bacillus licheniformis]
MESVTWWLAFGGGLLSFLSPCCLPLYPSFISYITGISVNDLKNHQSNSIAKPVVIHALSFLVGFSLIFYIIGFSASSIGRIFAENQNLIRMLGGVFVTTMGLFLLGIFQPKFMIKEWRFSFRKGKIGILNSVLIGIIFAAGWTPCIGPIFGAISYANISTPANTFINVTAYSLGFAIPFLLMAFFIGKVRFFLKYSNILMKIGGGLLVVIGILLYTNKMVWINIWYSNLTSLL